MIKLKPGDIFCTQNSMLFLGQMITTVQTFWSKDHESEYFHSGIILHQDGETFEGSWKNTRQNLFKAYVGQKVLVGRHQDMGLIEFAKGWNGIKHYEGKQYAGYRLLFFLLPPLAKYINFGFGVCSEITARFLFESGLWTHWKGLNPDDIADRIHHWKDFEVIFEGILQEKNRN